MCDKNNCFENTSQNTESQKYFINQRKLIIENIKTSLEQLTSEYNSVSRALAETNYHLDRIKKAPMWRLNIILEKILIRLGIPKKFLGKESIYLNLYEPHFDHLYELLNALDELYEDTGSASLAELTFPVTEKPLISVLILSFGRVDLTKKCLQSICSYFPSYPCEIIVSDDKSNDPALAELKSIEGLKVIEMHENMGWTRHVNVAVSSCLGEYIILLNNDVAVRPNSLDALINAIISSEEIGIVGSKLIYPSGKLQEAGGIIFNDGSAWNYGKNDNPAKPEYNYVREVDYVSGASIIFSKKTWDSVGGFDGDFYPAYYEDTDFAFRVRKMGKKVIFQPESVVVHIESATYSDDKGYRKSIILEENKKIFYSKWKDILQSEHFSKEANIIQARDRPVRSQKVILVIDHYIPEPDKDAGSKAIIDLICAIQNFGWKIKFWPDNLAYKKQYTNFLQQKGIEVAYAPWISDFENWLKSRSDIGMFLISRPEQAIKYIPLIRKLSPKKPIIYFGHDVHHLRLELEASIDKNRNPLPEAIRMKEIEKIIWRDADLSIYLSEDEVNLIKLINPDYKVKSIKPYYFERFYNDHDPPNSKDIIFVAGFNHPPNIDATKWFIKDIFPRILKKLPDARFLIVGSNPTQEIKKLASDNVQVTGYVSPQDLENIYAQARAAVIPLRFGAGVKLKVIESLHHGLPLVTTPVGAQGIPHLKNIAVVTDDASLIAQALVSLLTDDNIWMVQSKKQLNICANSYTFSEYQKSVSDAFKLFK